VENKQEHPMPGKPEQKRYVYGVRDRMTYDAARLKMPHQCVRVDTKRGVVVVKKGGAW